MSTWTTNQTMSLALFIITFVLQVIVRALRPVGEERPQNVNFDLTTIVGRSAANLAKKWWIAEIMTEGIWSANIFGINLASIIILTDWHQRGHAVEGLVLLLSGAALDFGQFTLCTLAEKHPDKFDSISKRECMIFGLVSLWLDSWAFILVVVDIKNQGWNEWLNAWALGIPSRGIGR
jgi:hypothetical protein